MRAYYQAQLLIGIVLMMGCRAGPPTGIGEDITGNLALTMVIFPDSSVQTILVVPWHKCHPYSHPYFSDDCKETTPVFVMDADVIVVRNGTEYPAYYVSPVEEDTLPPWIYLRYPPRLGHNPFYEVGIGTVQPGDEIHLRVSHAEYEDAEAVTTVPGPVVLENTLPDTLDATAEALIVRWRTSDKIARAFETDFRLIAEGDSARRTLVFLGNLVVESDEQSLTYEVAYSMEKLLDHLKDELSWLLSDDYSGPSFWDTYSRFYIAGRVFSLDEGLYYAGKVEWLGGPDKYSGFYTAPLRPYTNVENGAGLLAAYWVTESKEIFVKKELLLQLGESLQR